MLGQRLHNFAIMRLLGEGGMSSVYEAEHALIRRKVAVKVLRSELSVDGVQVQRFFNEARATSAIRHPNIVEVIDVGRLPDGVPYLVMELLEGESLAERLERVGALEIPIALDFAHQAACALEAAHALDVVHRDLKPDNLFLVPDPRRADRELVKVLDFGIAKLRGELAAPPFDTLVGAVLGTPPYMSPEQCRGLPEEIDERTDIYALGIILYEMICGRPPFVADGAGELMVLHMTEAPEPPSSLCPEIPEALEDVILCALAKRREDRFETMTEFNAALSEIAASIGVLDPYSVRRSSPSAQSGTRPAASSPTFESDTTLTAPKLAPALEALEARGRPSTRPMRRAPNADSASGVVPLEAALPPQREDQSGITPPRSADEVLEELDPSEIEPITSPSLNAEPSEVSRASERAVPVARAFAPDRGATREDSVEHGATPVVGPARARRSRRWFAGSIAGAGLLAAAGIAFLAFGHSLRSPHSSETARMPARAPVPVEAPPLSRTADPTPPPAPAPAEPAGATTPGEAEAAARSPFTAADPPVADRLSPSPPPVAVGAEPLVEEGVDVPAARETPPADARPAPATRADAAGTRTAAMAPARKWRARRATAPASPPRPLAPAAAPESAAASPQPPAAAPPPVELGYLNLDSAPWSDVFLGAERLGTTPLIRVPLPAGKHLLTLRNPELGTSTSYVVEIPPGKTVSRLVGWENR